MQGYQQGNYSVGNKECHVFTLLRSLIFFYLLEDVVILINLAMSYKLQLLEIFEVL